MLTLAEGRLLAGVIPAAEPEKLVRTIWSPTLKPVNFSSPNPTPDKAAIGWHEVKRDARTKLEIESTIKIVDSSSDVMPMLEAA